MNRPVAIISILLGVICLSLELRSIKQNLFLEEIGEYLLLFLFVVLSFNTLFKDYSHQEDKSGLSQYKLSLICLGLLTTILIHKYLQSDRVFGKTAFKAYNDTINHGITLDFKTNHNLKITQRYKFGETNYFGKYDRQGDTIFFNISTDFNLDKFGVIKSDTLVFKDIKYVIERH